ncbi:aldehyde dehydrogenase family protein [Sneathiella chungangensis]|uniref:Aldehyde dehydrogenase family protein n=1 Tax=Sneathiella chungangensis TaxID=1418234 RepID=A0A845MDD0_9PROT|nr:aldehyde dehydrogenase [Sneathiella chungangensis]MZR21326.1 aldehyde dehydrogenase family protein [Sneathiella chungangensis]
MKTIRKTMLLAGEEIEGMGGILSVVNPADGSLITEMRMASADQVDAAFARARAALSKNDWFTRPPHERASVLFRAAELMRERKETLASLQTSENGKTLKESLGQVDAAAGIVRYFASVSETVEAEAPPPRGPYLSVTTHEPVGIVAAITPWNSPLTMAAQKLAPALAAGNAVILKPSELTTLVSIELARAFIDAGLPEGLLSVLPGDHTVGEAIINHPDLAMVSFTGGTNAGRAIAEAVAGRFIPTILELGGKSPTIVFADADLEKAASDVSSAIFGSGGQSCVAGSRLFVEKSIYDDFMERLVAASKTLKVGPPLDESSHIGPMASTAQRARIEGYVEIARKDGGRIVLGGTRPDGADYDAGAYYLPTIIDGLDHASPVCQEEIFGSVLVVLPFTSEEDLIALANDTVFGLACGIWSRDLTKAWRVAGAIKAGTVWINTYKQLSIAAPFGGYKQSGLGREKGIQGLRAYQQTKSIYLGGLGG